MVLIGPGIWEQIYELRSRVGLVTLEGNWTKEEAWDSRPKSLIEIETVLHSGGGDDVAREDIIVNTVITSKKDGGHAFDPEIGGFSY